MIINYLSSSLTGQLISKYKLRSDYSQIERLPAIGLQQISKELHHQSSLRKLFLIAQGKSINL